MHLHPERRRSTSPMPPDQVKPTASSTHVHAAGLHSRHHDHHQHDQPTHTSSITQIQTTASPYIPGGGAARHSGEQTTSPTRLSFSQDTESSRPNPIPHSRSVPKKRHASTSSATSTFSRKNTASSSRSSKDNTKRLSGTINHRGRHANDWLFGGFSLRDQVVKLLGRDKEARASASSDEDEDGDRDVRGR